MSTDTKYKFKKGDRVMVIDRGSAHANALIKPNQVGTIEESKSVIPFVTLDNVGRFPIWQSDMELITAKPEQPAATDLDQQPAEAATEPRQRRKGERVRILPGATHRAGDHVGAIVTIDENGSDVPWCLTDKGERVPVSSHEMEDVPSEYGSPRPPRPALHTMNPIITILAANIVSIICTIAAFSLAINGVESWGWFLAAAAWCATRVDFRRYHAAKRSRPNL
jgi:hypothetical protein